jgi:tetratricopeptide (TPR) repeat protein
MATPQRENNAREQTIHERDVHEQANAMHARGELAEAAELLSAALAQSETSELWNDWGAVQASRGNSEDAERAFCRALRMEPDSRQVAENLGVLLFSQGRLADAREYLEQALANEPAPSHGASAANSGAVAVGASGGAVAVGAEVAEAATQRDVLLKMLARCPAKVVRPAASLPQGPHIPTKPAPPAETPTSAASGADAGAVTAAHANVRADASYDEWCTAAFGQRIPVPGVRIAASWPEDSPFGLKAYIALATLECECATELLREIAAKNIPGDIVEFGIFEGWWINYLFQQTERLGLRRRIYGFDSFEGLSEPHPEHDQQYWKKGQYACSLEQVGKNVKLAERPRLRLVKGFFEKSLHTPEAKLIEQFCYARIDCDIYQPARECLEYLGPRLADGAIVVFDDWPHLRGFGEQRALEEWLPTVPSLRFEFLFYGAIGHFYTRVHRLG